MCARVCVCVCVCVWSCGGRPGRGRTGRISPAGASVGFASPLRDSLKSHTRVLNLGLPCLGPCIQVSTAWGLHEDSLIFCNSHKRTCMGFRVRVCNGSLSGLSDNYECFSEGK